MKLFFGVANPRGSMLIGVIASASIMALLALSFAGFIRDMWLESNSIQSKGHEMILAQMIRAQLSTSESCMDALVNRAFNPSAKSIPLQIKLTENASQAERIKDNAKLLNWGLKINGLALTEINVAVSSFNGSTIYSGDVELEAESLSGRKSKYKTKKVTKLFVQVDDSAKRITNCYVQDSAQGMAEFTCKSLGGKYIAKTQKCDLSGLTKELLSDVGECPDGKYLAGFNDNGKKVCGTVPDVSAPSISTCTEQVSSCRGPAGGFKSCCATGTKSSCNVVSTAQGGSCTRDGLITVIRTYLCICS